MRLSELRPRFYGMPFIVDDGRETWPPVERMGEAKGLLFLCPVCFEANGGSVGTHAIMCWSPDVPRSFAPGPGRWYLLGTDELDVTLKGRKSDSVALTGGGCGAHFFVRGGGIE